MGFGIIILLRILFIACMVFIVGYVFGPFYKRPALRVITRVAVVLSIILFFAANALFFRGGPWRQGHHRQLAPYCAHSGQDTVVIHR